MRKCFLLLPLCPVYGLAMLAVLHLPADLTRGFFRLAFYGGLTATAVEYAVHFLYDKLLGVMFWDYSGTHMDLNRRVCVPFAVVWGPLTAFASGRCSPCCTPSPCTPPGAAGTAGADGGQLLHRPPAAPDPRRGPAGPAQPAGVSALAQHPVQPGPDVAVHRIPHGGLVENFMPQAGIQLQGSRP